MMNMIDVNVDSCNGEGCGSSSATALGRAHYKATDFVWISSCIQSHKTQHKECEL